MYKNCTIIYSTCWFSNSILSRHRQASELCSGQAQEDGRSGSDISQCAKLREDNGGTGHCSLIEEGTTWGRTDIFHFQYEEEWNASVQINKRLRGHPWENLPHVSRDGSQIDVLLGSAGGFDPKNTSREVPGKISSRETNFREFLPGFWKNSRNLKFQFWDRKSGHGKNPSEGQI